jgi:hypothetical protein
MVFSRGQKPRNRREAFGLERAAQVEDLLQMLFPGASIEWSVLRGDIQK